MYFHYKLKVYKQCRKQLVVYGTADNIITLSHLLLNLSETRIEISDIYGNDISLEKLIHNERINPVMDIMGVGYENFSI